MTQIEYLLTSLSEECAEVIQAVSKALRFGLDDLYKKKGTTPREDILNEVIDVAAILEMLIELGVFPQEYIDEKVNAKQDKVRKYMEYAKERGTLV